MPGQNFRVKKKGGAPEGNRNALKEGRHTARMLSARRAMRMELRRLILRVRATVAKARLLTPPPNVTVTRIDATPSPHRPNN